MNEQQGAQTQFTEGYWVTDDGLKLYYRDYLSSTASQSSTTASQSSSTASQSNTDPRSHVAVAQQPPLLCLHGLTRNASDFDEIAEYWAPHYRLIIPDMRGRGQSDYDSDWHNYQLDTYVKDTWQLLDHLQLKQVVVIGNSMGGLVAMIMAAQQAQRLKAVVLNDVAPEVNQEGITRIIKYLSGTTQSVTLEAATERVKALNHAFFPDFTDADWRQFALKLYKPDGQGTYVSAYDTGITRALVEGSAVPDNLWDSFTGLVTIPTLVLRGALSDLIDDRILEKMRAIKPDIQVATVPGRGHHPMLNESDAIAALDDFFAGLKLGLK